MSMQAGQLQAEDREACLLPQPVGGAQQSVGAVCFQIKASGQHTGQVDVVLWPLVSIQNKLPFPLDFRSEQKAELSGMHERMHCTDALLDRKVVPLL